MSHRSQRSLRRVRSFPIVAEEDDVAADKDQKKEKRAKAVKKATQQAVRHSVGNTVWPAAASVVHPAPQLWSLVERFVLDAEACC